MLLQQKADIYSQFISSRGNEYFCEIDEEYLTDRFNLTGLNTEVQYYQYALDLVTDVFDFDCDDDMREAIEKSARHLYGLVHARYIVTTRGLGKMVSLYQTYTSYMTDTRNSLTSSRNPTLANAPA
jgi:casein kinase II subunit beta